MAPKYSFPGVYMEEIPSTPAQIAQVKTDVPVFIGFTEKVLYEETDLTFLPKKIHSLTEFEAIFGFPEPVSVHATIANGALVNEVEISPVKFRLYYSLQMYFANGGAPCYICSAGTYGFTGETYETLLQALNCTAETDDITLIVIADAHLAGESNFYALYRRALEISATLRDRFTILDIFSADGEDSFLQIAPLFREQTGSQHLGFGAVYYPYLRTNISPSPDESLTHFDIDGELLSLESLKESHDVLYRSIKLSIEKQKIVLPPSGAVAGIYCRTDSQRGVWKAPANEHLNQVVRPMVMITDAVQSDMNVTQDGKSVNAIRAFTGKGTLVWGARTLTGNDNEWKYVPARRLCIMIEKSIRNGLTAYSSSPNESNTWIQIKAAVENFLTLLWRNGALQGSKPEQAFFVHVGLNSSMTAQDIADGQLVLQIGVAVTRPAEFIVFRISQRMQKEVSAQHPVRPARKFVRFTRKR